MAKVHVLPLCANLDGAVDMVNEGIFSPYCFAPFNDLVLIDSNFFTTVDGGICLMVEPAWEYIKNLCSSSIPSIVEGEKSSWLKLDSYVSRKYHLNYYQYTEWKAAISPNGSVDLKALDDICQRGTVRTPIWYMHNEMNSLPEVDRYVSI